VQRYLVQGCINAFRDLNPIKIDHQVEFTQTIPSGANFCRFIIGRKKPGDNDKWENYSRILEEKALERMEGSKKK
jgi:hypothetical protein